MELSLLETRILGALLEKEQTTPDQYPLSLNGLVTACNQKSNREPVMSLAEGEVQNTVDELVKRGLASEVLFGSRVTKYKHRFCNTEFSKLYLNSNELACICVMFLRGPQTPGELRTRTSRLCQFTDVSEVDSTLENLMEREGGPLIVRLEREPGKRESRYMHLFCSEEELAVYTRASPVSLDVHPVEKGAQHVERIEALEQLVQEMRKEIDELKTLWDDLNS